jgi:hypothetical protein
MDDIPGEEHACGGDDAGEQQQGEADAIRGEAIFDTEGWNPGHAGDGDELARCVSEYCDDGDCEAGNGCE